MPVRQGFNIGEGSPELGQWSVKMSPDAPPAWRVSASGHTPTNGAGSMDLGWFYDTIVVTPQRIMDPGMTRATLLSKAIFSGMVEDIDFGKVNEPWTLSGPSIVAWLGNGSSPSLGPCGYSSAGSVSLATFLTALFGGGTPAGRYVNGLTLTTAASCSANSITDDASGMETARQLIERWIRQTTDPTEWWCYPDGSCYFAVLGNSLPFVQTPEVLFASTVEEGVSGSTYLVPADFTLRRSCRDLLTEVNVNDGGSVSTTYWNSSEAGTWDPTIAQGQMYGSTGYGGRSAYYEGEGAQAAALGQFRHRMFYSVDTVDTVGACELRGRTSSRRPIASLVKPGDYVYVYDPHTYQSHNVNEVLVGGRVMFPAKRRVSQMSWPITPGMGVYRISNGSGDALDGQGQGTDYDVVTDLSDHVIFEDGTAEVYFEDSPPSARRMFHDFARAKSATASWR